MFHIILSNPNYHGFHKKAHDTAFQPEIILLQLSVLTVNEDYLLSWLCYLRASLCFNDEIGEVSCITE